MKFINRLKYALFTAVVTSGILFAAINGNAIKDNGDTITVNFRNLSMGDFIEMISKITHKNILVDGALKGTINFVATKPIKKSSLMQLANAILASKGYTIVNLGDFYKVVKSSQAASEGLPVVDTLSGDTMQTVMFPLHGANAAVIRAKIRPLLGREAKVISFKENNMLAVTARPRVLKSIAKIIDAIEQKGQKESTVVTLQNSNVKDIFTNAQQMSRKLFPQTIESEKVDVFKDEATNSIILVGKPRNVAKMIRYIKKLDMKGEDQTQKMYVIPLKNSNVEDMEKILSKLVAQMNNVAIKHRVKGGKPPSKAMVVADKERNALIVLATGEQIKNIRETIKKIDVPKAQVYVKARIVEINTDLAEQVGMRYGFEGGKVTAAGLMTLAGNLGAPSINISPNLLNLIQSEQVYTPPNGGQPYVVRNPGIKFNGNKIFALGAAIDLLKRHGAAHILSEPSVLCTNNKEATIQVGQTQSILTKAQQSTQGQGNIINQYSREDIGITLKVKPRLSSNNKVALDVEAEIEDIVPGSGASADRPTTTKRKVNTSAIVNNGETVILGGLIKRSGGNSVTKVPLLGDIPVLGNLFKSEGDRGSEINVAIYLTPYIVRKSDDLAKLRDALNELEEVQAEYSRYIEKLLAKRKGIDLGGEKIGHASGRIKGYVKPVIHITQDKEAEERR